jgi:hypothetical protein
MQRYERSLARWPLATNMVGAGSLFFLGDVVCQALELSRASESVHPPGKGYNAVRTMRMAFHGACVNATLYHVFLTSLRRGNIWGVPMPSAWRAVLRGGGWAATLLTVLIDQTAWTVTINIVHFISIGLLEGNTPAATWRKLRKGLMATMVAGYRMWPAIQLAVFKLVPPRHQLMVVMVCNFFWSIILSGLVNKRTVSAVVDCNRKANARVDEAK